MKRLSLFLYSDIVGMKVYDEFDDNIGQLKDVYVTTEDGNPKFIGYALLLLFPICGAYRLARYNASSFDGVFTGIPITVAGSFIALFVLITTFTESVYVMKGLPIAFLLLLSYLMVSNYKFKKV